MEPKPGEGAVGEKSENDGRPSPMNPWERWTAGIIGLSAGGVGIAAVFFSDNQAGTAALFVVAGAFLLIGVQGTPLKRFGSGDNNAEFAAREANNKLERAKEAKKDGDQESAENLVDDAVRIDPSVENLPVVQEVRYERRVADAVRRIFGHTPGFELATEPRVRRYRPDFILTSNGHHINVEVTHRQRELGVTVLQSFEHMARTTGRPTLLITNAPLSDAVMQLNGRAEDTPVEVVQWTGANDDDLLERAALRLLHH